MIPDLQAPSYTYTEVQSCAHEFLERYWPTGRPPVDIGAIAEFDLGLNIVPVRGLKRLTTADAFLYSDLSAIAVDDEGMNRYEFRYRFSLAHETAHFVLHPDLYSALAFRSVADYVQFHAQMDLQTWSLLDRQADWFAGLVLVPRGPLEEAVKAAVDLCGRNGLSPARAWAGPGWRHICSEIGSSYNVSRDVVKRQIELDGLDRQFGLVDAEKQSGLRRRR